MIHIESESVTIDLEGGIVVHIESESGLVIYIESKSVTLGLEGE